MKKIFIVPGLLFFMAGLTWAADYVWLPTDWASYAAVGNWEVGGSPATTIPGTNDRLFDFQSFMFDLGGGSYEVGGWRATYDWNQWNMYLRNGRLCFTGVVEVHNGIIDLSDGAILAFGHQSTFTPAVWSGDARKIFVNDGTMFDFQGGTLRLYKMQLFVRAGGVADLAYGSVALVNGTQQENIFENSGTLFLTNGVFLTEGSEYNGKLKIHQKAGVLAIGGKVSKKGLQSRIEVILEGGKVTVTEDVDFEVTSAQFPNNATLEMVITGGKVFDITPFTYGSNVALKQSGAGTLRVGASLPASLQIDNGALACGIANQSYDLGGVTMATGTRLIMAMQGIKLSAVPDGMQYTFEVDTNSVPFGVPFVETADSTLRARIKADIESGLSEDFMLLESGDALILSTAYLFNSATTTDWHDPDGWVNGEIPPANKNVLISGTGVLARIDADILPCKSITVMDGATLAIATDLTLAKVLLDRAATLHIEEDALLEISDGIVAHAVQLADISTLIVDSDARLKLPVNTVLANIDLRLYGELESAGIGRLTLGYAAAGETNYFKMTGDGGKIIMPPSGSYNISLLQVGCPEAGGAVVIPEPMLWRQMTLPAVSWQKLHGARFGVNNPVEHPFTVIVDNTSMRRGSYCDISGAATICLTNNATFDSEDNDNLMHNLRINKRGRVVVYEGALLSHLIANGGWSPMSIDPDDDNFDAIVLRGGNIRLYDTKGNDKACLKVYGGTFEIYRQYNVNALTTPFKGLKRVEIADESTLTIRRMNSYIMDNQPVVLADVPLEGTGSLFIDNDKEECFELVLVNAHNSVTGTIAASNKARVLFADGANWNGTVVANGNAALTNLNAEAFFATNAFERLELQEEFVLRVGAQGNDTLIMGSGGFSGSGCLAIRGVDDYDFKAANKPIKLGSVLKSAKNLPACDAQGWGLRLRDNPDAENCLDFWLVRSGLFIMLN